MSLGPIFMVGTMRSGSTLFRLILDAHPNIAISEETGFMGALAATKTIPHWHHGRGWYDRLGWSEEELDARLRKFYSGMFERYAVSQGKKRWGDKTPFHSRHIAEMARVFPDAVFVAIIRHPGAVVNSLVQKFHYEVSDAAGYWEQTNLEILRHGAVLGDSRFALVRYEDLVLHSEITLRELMYWLDESWSDDLLQHNQVQARKGAPRISAGSTRTRDPINSEVPSHWLEELDEHQREMLAAKSGALARFLGYDPTSSAEPAHIVPPYVEGRTKLLTGGVLGHLQRRHHDGLSFEPRSEPVILPDMDAAEVAKRLQQAEWALARIQARKAVRWSNAAHRIQRRAAGIPTELFDVARRNFR